MIERIEIMLGKIILEQRKLLNIKSKHLAETVGIDPGFLTHIEKGDRNPSKSVLAKICKELHLSYEFMLSLSENSLKEESVAYNASIHTPAKKVLYAETFSLLDCPVTEENVSLIVKMDDDSMEDLIPKSSLIYIHYTSVLSNGDLAAVWYNGRVYYRKFFCENGKITLKAINKKYNNISVDFADRDLIIVGKIINN